MNGSTEWFLLQMATSSLGINDVWTEYVPPSDVKPKRSTKVRCQKRKKRKSSSISRRRNR